MSVRVWSIIRCRHLWRVALCLVACLAGCHRTTEPPPSPASKPAVTTGPVQAEPRPDAPRSKSQSNHPSSVQCPRFEDVAVKIGVDFTYLNGATGRSLMVESIGGGAGWLDYDGDGLLDLFLCQGGNPAPPEGEMQPSDQLFRQVEPGRFERITEPAAINEQGYSNGVAVADFDDDGFDDVYISNVGRDTLLHNLGDGTFHDVTVTANVSNPLWTTSAAWGDLDEDGDLDLYVCNYVDYDPFHPKPCFDGTRPGVCHPRDMDPVPDECYFNQGDGAFTAEAHERGLFGSGNKGLGVVIADLNNDGHRDVYVANDTTPNFLFLNQGQGRFQESAFQMGCAVSREGSPQASMGVAIGDYDRNGWLDLYCTHFTNESNTLYKNLGSVGFQDVTGLVGLHAPTLPKLAFGTIMTDFNQDGHEDIFVTNGHIDDWRSRGEDREMQPQLFSYEGPRFVDCSDKGGEFFSRKLIGRAVACGDFDGDGDWDLAVVHQNTPTALLLNESLRGNWLKLRFVAITNRRGVGTRVVLRQGSTVLTQELVGGSSFCAAHEPALIFGLADQNTPCDLEIVWPDGTHQGVKDVAVNQIMTIRQGRLSQSD